MVKQSEWEKCPLLGEKYRNLKSKTSKCGQNGCIVLENLQKTSKNGQNENMYYFFNLISFCHEIPVIKAAITRNHSPGILYLIIAPGKGMV